MTIRTLLPGLTAAVLAATAVVVATSGTPTNAADDDTTTMSFAISEQKVSHKYVDQGRKGPSIGDRHLTALSLTRDGAVAGRLLIECLALDRTYQGQTCDLALQLADGTVFFEGVGFHEVVPNVGTGDDTTYAVTGGAGAYRGASGEVTIGLEDDGPVTVVLLP